MKKILNNLFPESLKAEYRNLRSLYGSAIYGFPAKKLKLIGVTGTSGKSTTASIVYHLLEQNGFKTGLVSTVGAKAGKKNLDTGLHVTTPDPIQLQKILKFMVEREMEYVVIECSSHALAQGRLGNLVFDYSIFTNIKRDHLDWHKTWEHYADSKAKLALKTKPEGKIIINRDDKEMYDFLLSKLGSSRFNSQVITYSFKEILNIEENFDGIKFRLNDFNFALPMIGVYNIENALAAINIATLLGLNNQQIADALKLFPGVIGRMEVMYKEKFLVIVDFAHNTDSLVKSLKTAKKLIRSNGKLITVFGSAGLRDIEKRFTMGEVASEIADVVVITAEDPRTESLYEINNQIIEGSEKSGGKLVQRFANTEEYLDYKVEDEVKRGSVFVFDQESIDSRFDAIDFAIKIANDGDVIITEGKGHEESLCFGETEYPFTDQEAVNRALERLGVVGSSSDE